MTVAAFSPVARQETSVGSGAKLYSFEAGGELVALATYSDVGLTTPNANPLLADASGRFGPIYLQAASYYFKLTDANDITQWTQDNVADLGSLLQTSLDSQLPATVFCTSQFNATSGTTGTTLTAVTGLSQTVSAGTYLVSANLPGTATANCGLKVAFKYTTTALTSLEITGRGFTASGLVVQHTTSTTDQASLLASTTAIISAELVGRIVVSTGGQIAIQAAQNSAHADQTSLFVGGSLVLTKVS